MGRNFSPNLLGNVVYFGPVKGTVTSASANSLSVQVPYGAGYGPVTVSVSNLTCYSSNYFNPAYFGASTSNPILMQAVATNYLTNSLGSPVDALNDMGFADINGDGKGDLAYTGPLVHPDTVGGTTVLENTSVGPGSFALDSGAPYSLATSEDPSAMAFGDVDGDGLLDWVWVDYEASSVEVVRNASSPTNIMFGGGTYNSYVTGLRPLGVKVIDFDGDGRPDIVVANYGANTVSVYRNLSSGPGSLTFGQKVDYTVCAFPRALVVGDFNGDGKPDIAVVGFTTTGSNLVILTNMSTPGKISFSTAIPVAALDEPQSLAVGDFNGDGKLDIAVGSLGSAEVLIFTNNGSSGSTSFVQGPHLPTPLYDPRQIAIADLNGDGLPDIAVIDAYEYTVSVYRNAGSGSFVLSKSYPTGSDSTPTALLSGDVDGDGRPDLVVGNTGTTNMIIYQNTSRY